MARPEPRAGRREVRVPTTALAIGVEIRAEHLEPEPHADHHVSGLVIGDGADLRRL